MMETTSKERQIGYESLASFVRIIADVIQNNDFSHIFAASDSGQLAAFITGLIYDELHIIRPPVIALPIFRHTDKKRLEEFDNTIIASHYRHLSHSQIKHALFIDDEIWHGVTFRGFFSVLNEIKSLPSTCTIVAEDGGFITPKNIYNIPVYFIPTKRRVPDIYNSFSHTIPEQIVRMLDSIEFVNDKQIMCTLLGLPTKDWNEGKPIFSDKYIKLCSGNIQNFKGIKLEYLKWLTATIKSYLNLI